LNRAVPETGCCFSVVEADSSGLATVETSDGSWFGLSPEQRRCGRRMMMKMTKTAAHGHEGHHVHHIGREGSHVMLPLVGLSLMALGLYFGVRQIEFSELGRSALFYVVMVFVALGIAGLFGVVGAWLRSNGDEAQEGFCFTGALIGAAVFYVALLT
jgi:hypothetical protein